MQVDVSSYMSWKDDPHPQPPKPPIFLSWRVSEVGQDTGVGTNGKLGRGHYPLLKPT